MSTPTPPAGVIAAVAALRAAFDDLHVMHECDDDCPQDCDLSDYSESAYRYHDEHNFDVREGIEDRASGLVDALEEWLGPNALAQPAQGFIDRGLPTPARPVEVGEWVSEIDGAHVMQIDTAQKSGRVRVVINDGTIYDGDPLTDDPPGAHYAERPEWEKRRLVRAGDDGQVQCCDECGAATDTAVSAEHEHSCSLHPDNFVG